MFRCSGLFSAIALTGCITADVELPGGRATRPYGGSAHGIPGTIEAEHYDEGASGKAYLDVDEKNHGAAYRGVTQVDIEKRPDASGGHGIGWTKAGEWVVYTVHVTEPGRYSVEFPVASAKKGGTFHLELDGRAITDAIDVPNTGSWQQLEIIRTETVPLKRGVQRLKMVMDTNGETNSIGDIDLLRFTKLEE
jgi:hypothetical protein